MKNVTKPELENLIGLFPYVLIFLGKEATRINAEILRSLLEQNLNLPKNEIKIGLYTKIPAFFVEFELTPEMDRGALISRLKQLEERSLSSISVCNKSLADCFPAN